MSYDLAAALLRDVPTRYQPVNGDRLLHETDVLTALTAALDPAIAERAGEIVSELREVAAVFTKDTVFTDAADLITALLAQNAALRAELDKWMERCGRERAFASSHRISAETAEAEVERLREAIRKLKREWYLRDLQSNDFDAALTTGADNG